MSSLFPRRGAVAVLALLALGLAACGTETLDVGDVESEIRKDAEQDNVTLSSVECRDDIEAEEGRRDTCEVTVEGGDSYEVAIVQTDDDGTFRVELPPELAGSGDSGASAEDEETIRSLFAAIDEDPATICRPEASTDEFIATAFPSRKECEAAAAGEEAEETTINSIEIEGDKATAEVEDADGPSTVELVKDPERGWLVASSVDG